MKEAKIIQRNGQMLALLMLTEVFLTVLEDMYLDNFTITINHTFFLLLVSASGMDERLVLTSSG